MGAGREDCVHAGLFIAQGWGGGWGGSAAFKGSGLCGLTVVSPRILWVGIENKDGRLKKLKDALDNFFLDFGIKPDEREFSPHLTIGRVKFLKTKNPYAHIHEKVVNLYFGNIHISNFHIFSSILTPKGPIYTKIKNISLTPNSFDQICFNK